MKLLYTLCFLFLGFIADCQKTARGIVVNEIDKQAVSKAKIFLNGTSISTTTNEQGEFSIQVPFGRHILVCISAGSETYGQFINSEGALDSIHIYLKPSEKKITGYERDGWEKWGDYFLDNFLGSDVNGQYKIKNPKVLKFKLPNTTGDLLIFAEEPLIIENKALGYTLFYKLESFHSNFSTALFNYNGYFFFQPMTGNSSQQLNWDKRRSQAYAGSLMHFMRSVYRNQLEEEGFDVRSLKKIPNVPVKNTNSNDAHLGISVPIASIDSNDIQDQILNPDNYKDIIGTSLPGDSIAYAIGKTRASLYFEHFLLVIYKGRLLDEEENDVGNMTSQLVLINKTPVEIEADGSFYDYRDLIVLGYWAWSEKISRILPLDYSPRKTK